MFAATGPQRGGAFKDTLANVEATREFVVNMATWELREAMNASAAPAPPDIDEFALAGLNRRAGGARRAAARRREPGPSRMRARHYGGVAELGQGPAEHGGGSARSRGIHIADGAIEEGMVRYDRLCVIGRLGYGDYARVDTVFDMVRPDWP